MPCITLSSGKTVCYGESTYQSGGYIIADNGLKNNDISKLTAPNMQGAFNNFQKQQQQIKQNIANSNGMLPGQTTPVRPTTTPTNVYRAPKTSNVTPLMKPSVSAVSSTGVARPSASAIQGAMKAKEEDPLGYKAEAARMEANRGKSFTQRALEDAASWAEENKDAAAFIAPLAGLAATEVIPGIAAEKAAVELPSALSEAYELGNAGYKAYQTIDKGVNAAQNLSKGNYAGAAGNLIEFGQAFIPGSKLTNTQSVGLDVTSGALSGFGDTGTIEGTLRGTFDNTVGDRGAQKIVGDKDSLTRNFLKQNLKGFEQGIDISNFNNGGYIIADKGTATKRKSNTVTKEEREKFHKDAVAFEEGWLNSPMYKQMLTNSVAKDNPTGFDSQYVDYITEKRREGLNAWQPTGIPFTEETRQAYYPEKNAYKYLNNLQGFNYADPIGETKVFGKTVPALNILPDLNAAPDLFLLNQPGTAYNNSAYWLKPSKGYFTTYLKDNLNWWNYADDANHEVAHATDWNGKFIPTSDIKLMENLRTDINLLPKGKQDYAKYVADPSETRARLQSLRGLAKRVGYYDPYTQKATMDVLNKFKKVNNSQYLQLRGIYSDEDILKMLNSVSMNNNESNSNLV